MIRRQVDVRHGAEHRHTIADVHRERVDRGALRSVADDDQSQVRPFRTPELANAPTAIGNPLRSSSRPTKSELASRPQIRRLGVREAIDVDAVRHDPEGTADPRAPRTARRRGTRRPAPRCAAVTRRINGAAAVNRRDPSAPEWNVATTGAREASVAHIEVLGVSGSCACRTSGRKSRRASLTAGYDHGRGSIGALDALYRRLTGRPTTCTQGSGTACRAGVRTFTSWPSPNR